MRSRVILLVLVAMFTAVLYGSINAADNTQGCPSPSPSPTITPTESPSPTPTPTPTPTPPPTPTPTPTPTEPPEPPDVQDAPVELMYTP